MDCREFPGLEYRVCRAFLAFYDENDGAFLFGNPISNEERYGDYIVQYFENARLDWRPDASLDQSIWVAELGPQFFSQSGESQAYLEPEIPIEAGPDTGVLDLRVRAYPQEAVTGLQGEQTLQKEGTR